MKNEIFPSLNLFFLILDSFFSPNLRRSEIVAKRVYFMTYFGAIKNVRSWYVGVKCNIFKFILKLNIKSNNNIIERGENMSTKNETNAKNEKKPYPFHS